MPGTPYLLGHSEHEVHRLQMQATVMARITRRLLEELGLAPGMRVLDIGCGAGDVTLLAAEMVGHTGHVVGFDREASVLETASARARDGGLANVEFLPGTIEEMAGDFDLVVGRYILMHQDDPAALVRAAAAHTRSDGIVAFHEVNGAGPVLSALHVPLWHQVSDQIITALSGLKHPTVGSYLISLFQDAGLATPHVFCELPTGGGNDSPVDEWLALTYQSLLPILSDMNVADPTLVACEDLTEELRRAVVTARAQVAAGFQHCAWVRV